MAVGGFGNGEYSDPCDNWVLTPEIYDPATNQWTQMADMAEYRLDHSSVPNDDYLLLAAKPAPLRGRPSNSTSPRQPLDPLESADRPRRLEKQTQCRRPSACDVPDEDAAYIGTFQFQVSGSATGPFTYEFDTKFTGLFGADIQSLQVSVGA